MGYLTIKKVGESTEINLPEPNLVNPGKEIIKSAERTIDGTMAVDVSAVKNKLDVIYSVLKQEDFKEILKLTDITNFPEGLIIDYLGNMDKNQKEATEDKKWYLDDIKYTPFFLGNEHKWQNVILTFIEI
jgi:hypothetical protein